MKLIMPIVTLLMLLAITGCSKTSEIKPEETLTKFAAPDWRTNETGKYSASMTAVVSLPIALNSKMSEGDQLAAFVNDECRGTGVLVKIDSSNIFFVLIQGQPDEQSKVKFKYYSTKTAFMYESQNPLNFLVDALYGTAQKPKALDLIQLK